MYHCGSFELCWRPPDHGSVNIRVALWTMTLAIQTIRVALQADCESGNMTMFISSIYYVEGVNINKAMYHCRYSNKHKGPDCRHMLKLILD